MGWITSLFSKTASDGPTTHDVFSQAIGDKHEVTFDYQGIKDPAPQTRTVIPVRQEGTHIVAFDPDKRSGQDDGYRKFNPKNISLIHGTRPRSIEPPEEAPKAKPSDSTGVYVPQEFAPEGSYPKPKPFGGPALAPSQPVNKKVMPWDARDRAEDWMLKDNETKPWEHNDAYRMPREYAVNPTPEEYKEAKSLDFHPDSFDKATYKRLRNMPGVTHVEIKDALQSGIPIEDYETARINNPDSHPSAKTEALNYQNYYDRMIFKNRMQKALAQGRKYSGVELLSPDDHLNLVKSLTFHHGSLKNAPSFSHPFPDTPWRRRANRWVMGECAKLEPSVKKYAKVDNLYDENAIHKPVAYDKLVKALLMHHTVKQMNAETTKDYMISNRMINALTNIGSSKFLPTLYTHDKYEE